MSEFREESRVFPKGSPFFGCADNMTSRQRSAVVYGHLAILSLEKCPAGSINSWPTVPNSIDIVKGKRTRLYALWSSLRPTARELLRPVLRKLSDRCFYTHARVICGR